jgi:hypothetical protein
MSDLSTSPEELDGEADSPRSTKGSRWGQDRRLEFIDFRLLYEGKINRSAVVEFFGVSIQQASLDFARYMELAENNMQYDKSEKIYRSSPQFSPKFVTPDAQSYLNELAHLGSGLLSPAFSFIGSRLIASVVSLPVRRVGTNELLAVLWAIRDKSEIEITYQSMRRPDPTRRWIAPHALAFDGARWHARAWCHESNAFRDFVLTRIQETHGRRASQIDAWSDKDWHEYETIVIEPRPDLTRSQRDTVITDFQMLNGKLNLSVRRALVKYYVRHLQIEPIDVRRQPIVWTNREALKDVASFEAKVVPVEAKQEGSENA